jgi:pyruvate/2-oxoglutarate dehydrogenase complex dihydrolipoamide dehydrogenase (E3) component
MTNKYDAIVIGTGQAGPSLAHRLTQHKMKTAIIERNRFGGTCVNVGCIPTKTLVASARAAYLARRGQEFGVVIDGSVEIDMKRVKARKDAVVQQSRDGLANWLKNMPGLKVYEGHGRFEGPRTIRVHNKLLEADKVFINVGARAAIPDMPGLNDVDFLTNSSMMEVDFLPEHLIIVGGSYIGLEFAQIYRRFGSRVTVIQRNQRLIPRDDQDVSNTVKEILESEGIEVHLNATCIAMEKKNDRIIAKLDCTGGPKEVAGSHLLLAVGRRPNSIWALGDVNGQGAFTHTSYNDYEIVAANLLDNDRRRVSDRILCYGLFIDPPLGRAGMTEKEVLKSGRKALIGKMKMTRVGRARERSETRGFMKILIDKETLKILGAAILGIGGDEVIHSILDVMYTGAPYTVIQRAVHIHPTVTELIPTMLADLKPLA